MAEMHETLVTWLRDAHAMEAAAVNNLERQLDRFKDYPTVQSKFAEDLEASRRNVQQIEWCLDRLGSDRSVLKDLGMKLTGITEPWLGAMTPDEPVKLLLAAAAYENFEAASFASLTAAAEQVGDMEIKQVCERSHHQKREMADWIKDQLPTVTREYMRRAH